MKERQLSEELVTWPDVVLRIVHKTCSSYRYFLRYRGESVYW